eukprot:746136-Hanusia_phi.AAC.1
MSDDLFRAKFSSRLLRRRSVRVILYHPGRPGGPDSVFRAGYRTLPLGERVDAVKRYVDNGRARRQRRRGRR